MGVLLACCSTNLTPVQAPTTIFLHPAADSEESASNNFAFAYVPHVNRDAQADAVNVLILDAASQAVTDWLISVASWFDI